MNRRIQDLEGESKRSKIEAQDQRLKLGTAIREHQEETAKLNNVLKQMATQIIELEEDLAVSEQNCDEYEQLVQSLKEGK